MVSEEVVSSKLDPSSSSELDGDGRLGKLIRLDKLDRLDRLDTLLDKLDKSEVEVSELDVDNEIELSDHQ